MVEVWYVGGILETFPVQATIGKLSSIPTEQHEGADLTEAALTNSLSQFPSEDRLLVVKSISYDEAQGNWSIQLESPDDKS